MKFDGEGIIIFGFLCFLIAKAILLALKMKNKKIFSWFKELVELFFVLYALMVFSVTLFPLYVGIPHETFSFRFINFIPLISIFKEISQIGIAYDGDALFMIILIAKNVGGNILMFMPLGFLVPVLWKGCKQFKNVLMVGLIVSLSIECLQVVENLLGIVMGRAVDIDDVICNAFGAILGYSIYKLMILLMAKRNGTSKLLGYLKG